MGEGEYGALVDLIYQTVVEPELWPRVLERLADLMGGGSGTVIRQNQVTGESDGINVRIDPVAGDLFRKYYGFRNPLQKLTDPVTAARRISPPILNDEHSLPKTEFLRTEYYSDFLSKFDVHSLAIVNLAVVGVDDIAISINRTRLQAQFSDADLAVAARVRPHLVRAFSLGRQVAATQGVSGDLAKIMDRSPGGVALLNRHAAVLYANRAFQALLAKRDGLAVISGRLTTAWPRDAGALDALLARAGGRDPARRGGGTLGLGGPSRRRPLSVTVGPFRSDRYSLFGEGPSIIVCVTDLQAEVSLADDRLQTLFDLSPAELRVARALFEGLSPKEAAESLGISFFTVRGHLARIRAKTDTRGQVDLARLLMRIGQVESGARGG